MRTARVYASCERYHTGIILYALPVALVESPYIDTREPHETAGFRQMSTGPSDASPDGPDLFI